MINLSKFLPFFILLVLLLHLIYLSYLSNVYRACSFFYEFRQFYIDNARVIYRKNRVFQDLGIVCLKVSYKYEQLLLK
jgi:hypothetical protein